MLRDIYYAGTPSRMGALFLPREALAHRLKWTLNTSGYAPEVYRVSDFELGEDYY